jgi:hypothetical protein
MTETVCPYCGPGVRTYRDEGDPPDNRYCARCGQPIRFRVTLPYSEVCMHMQVRVTLPYSEVCMHMQVAGTTMLVERVGLHAVQLLDDDGRLFSSPITAGEAGVS